MAALGRGPPDGCDGAALSFPAPRHGGRGGGGDGHRGNCGDGSSAWRRCGGRGDGEALGPAPCRRPPRLGLQGVSLVKWRSRRSTEPRFQVRILGETPVRPPSLGGGPPAPLGAPRRGPPGRGETWGANGVRGMAERFKASHLKCEEAVLPQVRILFPLRPFGASWGPFGVSWGPFGAPKTLEGLWGPDLRGPLGGPSLRGRTPRPSWIVRSRAKGLRTGLWVRRGPPLRGEPHGAFRRAG